MADFDDLAEFDVVLLDFPELLVFSDLLVTLRYLVTFLFNVILVNSVRVNASALGDWESTAAMPTARINIPDVSFIVAETIVQNGLD